MSANAKNGSCVTLVVDESSESAAAVRLLEEAHVRFVAVSSRPDVDSLVTELPAVWVPSDGHTQGELFRGLRNIRLLFLPRYLRKLQIATSGQ